MARTPLRKPVSIYLAGCDLLQKVKQDGRYENKAAYTVLVLVLVLVLNVEGKKEILGLYIYQKRRGPM